VFIGVKVFLCDLCGERSLARTVFLSGVPRSIIDSAAQQGESLVQIKEQHSVRRLVMGVTIVLVIVNACASLLLIHAYDERRWKVDYEREIGPPGARFLTNPPRPPSFDPVSMARVRPSAYDSFLTRLIPGLMALVMLAVTASVMFSLRKALHWSLLALSLSLPVVNLVIGIAIYRM
jgi:hypothetical protein